MPYCSKCGKELSKDQKFCHSCGSEVGKNNVNKNKKWLFILGGIIFVLLLVFFTFGNRSQTGLSVNNEKKECANECCSGDEYKEKLCPQNYGCENNQCIAIDSDNDGLSDIEEKEIGTNPQLFDTDGDTLSDYKELKELGTNPLNTNTDNDRYLDNNDKDPLLANSAKINIGIVSKSWNWKYGNIILSILGGAVINPDLVVAEPTTTILVENLGDDYTDYVSYDIFFKVSNILVDTENARLNRINSYEKNTLVYTNPITTGEIPDLLINAVSEQTTNWNIEVGNLKYEKFP